MYSLGGRLSMGASHAHHELVSRPLHDEGHPSEPALDPHQLELEALGQAVDPQLVR
jgi:hypothetical protein